jgi:hypothetical protein
LGAFFAAGGLIDYFRTAGFSGPTPRYSIPVNALTGSREFSGAAKNRAIRSNLFCPSRAGQKSISASIPCAAQNRHPWRF